MIWLIVHIAHADGGERPLARPGQVPQERLYALLDGTDGPGPVSPRSRRRRSAPFLVWEFEDGGVQRYQRSEGRALLEERQYDAAGRRLATVTFGETLPESVTVHTAEPVTLDVSAWMTREVDGSRVLAPGPGAPRPGGGLRWTVLDGRFEVWSGAAGDVFSDDWRDGLKAGCGCIVLDRVTAWVDGQPGVRYRLSPPEPRGQVVDVWAVPRGERVWLASYVVAGDHPESLAAGQAVVSLVRLGPFEEEAP